jgi:exonuclease SbcD
VGLFSSFLGKLKLRKPSLEILILPGNHDSSARLGFGKELFAELGIHFVTDPEEADKPLLIEGRSGGDKTRAAFFLLPFLNPGSLRQEPDPSGETGEPIRSQAKLAEAAAARLEQARLGAVREGADHTVLGAHLFTAGGMESESERVFLGTAERVNPGLFGGFDYVGLGHLHRFQRAGDKAWYSGSPLAYSFDEGNYEKVFLSVELEKNSAPRVSPIPVKPLRKLRSLRGPFNYFFRGSLEDIPLQGAAEDYLEITLTDPELVENPLALLRGRFPHILSIKQGEAFAALSAGKTPDAPANPPGVRRSPEEDFGDFLTEIYGREDPEKLKLFQELLAELAEQEDLQ